MGSVTTLSTPGIDDNYSVTSTKVDASAASDADKDLQTSSLVNAEKKVLSRNDSLKSDNVVANSAGPWPEHSLFEEDKMIGTNIVGNDNSVSNTRRGLMAKGNPASVAVTRSIVDLHSLVRKAHAQVPQRLELQNKTPPAAAPHVTTVVQKDAGILSTSSDVEWPALSSKVVEPTRPRFHAVPADNVDKPEGQQAICGDQETATDAEPIRTARAIAAESGSGRIELEQSADAARAPMMLPIIWPGTVTGGGVGARTVAFQPGNATPRVGLAMVSGVYYIKHADNISVWSIHNDLQRQEFALQEAFTTTEWYQTSQWDWQLKTLYMSFANSWGCRRHWNTLIPLHRPEGPFMPASQLRILGNVITSKSSARAWLCQIKHQAHDASAPRLQVLAPRLLVCSSEWCCSLVLSIRLNFNTSGLEIGPL
ncbi:hypothetical protein HPB49_013277 [Dermacentor silvarum]|uniref:Uncharacterized protein n=1 Tax=Dermacentor silvarum TaxID=543639 RepID=A0ACB8C3T1_DERSI|nr:hypothetical protein HPB49_013277 [Dermacentor silvarum]